jgi:hypothetical protein
LQKKEKSFSTEFYCPFLSISVHHGSSWIIMVCSLARDTRPQAIAKHVIACSTALDAWHFEASGVILSGNSTIVGISWLKLIPAIS